MSRKGSITEVECSRISARFRWSIENFSRLDPTVGHSIRSSEFSADADAETKFWLELYPNGGCEHSKDFISLFLNWKSDCNEVTATFALIDYQNNEHCATDLPNGRQDFRETSKSWGFPMYVSRDVLSTEGVESRQVLVADRLTIECQISYVKSVGPSPKSKYPKELIKDLENLYRTRKDFDVILDVDGKEFRAHKLILRARSSVFDAMFGNRPEKESIENRVKIEDIGKDVFEAVLEFMYTAKIDRKDIDFKQLFVAADRYDLNDLKVICEKEIASKLTVDSVCDSLLLADRHSAQELKERAVQFIRKHKKSVMVTEGWKELSKNPDLLNYVFERL